MKIKRVKNDMGCYDYQFIEGNKVLRIFYAGNLDLYMSLANGEMFGEENKSISFDITKEDYEVYTIFDTLYKDVISGNVFETMEDGSQEDFGLKDYKVSFQYCNLVDENMNINWVSDDGILEAEDSLTFSLIDNDTYRFTFNRNDKPLGDGFKSDGCISVRFRNSGSRYDPFNCPFMFMYQRLQNLDPDVHQVHMVELDYIKRKKIESKS